MTPSKLQALFAAMCLIWGLTWIAIKIGIAAVPPLFFAGTRFAAAGALLLLWLRLSGASIRLRRRDVGPLALSAALVIVGTYSLLFWGMQHVSSGLSAIINLALMPVMLYGLGLAYGEERASMRQTAAITLGIAGLALLFGPKATAGDMPGLLGIAAIVLGTFAYCWGSVLSRPILRVHSPLLVSAVTTLGGGFALIALSLLLEPVAVAGFADPAVIASWLFLVLFGSLLAFTFYMRLLRDWGAARAGMYAFVSPVIAVAVGALWFGERVGTIDLAGMAMMLAATWLALTRRAAVGGAAPAHRAAEAGP